MGSDAASSVGYALKLTPKGLKAVGTASGAADGDDKASVRPAAEMATTKASTQQVKPRLDEPAAATPEKAASEVPSATARAAEGLQARTCR